MNERRWGRPLRTAVEEETLSTKPQDVPSGKQMLTTQRKQSASRHAERGSQPDPTLVLSAKKTMGSKAGRRGRVELCQPGLRGRQTAASNQRRETSRTRASRWEGGDQPNPILVAGDRENDQRRGRSGKEEMRRLCQPELMRRRVDNRITAGKVQAKRKRYTRVIKDHPRRWAMPLLDAVSQCRQGDRHEKRKDGKEKRGRCSGLSFLDQQTGVEDRAGRHAVS